METRTEAQQSASRTNGAKSHGPTSESGKSRSSQNSLRHGLFSARIVLANESQEQFDELFTELHDEYRPVGPTENQLVQDIAVARWRIRRLENMEAAAYDTAMFSHKQTFEECFQPNDPAMRHSDATASLLAQAPGMLEFTGRSLQRLHRVFCRSISELTRIQARRLRQEHAESKPAQPQQPSENMRNEPGDPPPVASRNGKTYIEPERFTFVSNIDRSKLIVSIAPEPPAETKWGLVYDPAA